jgi:hypothetical protein
MDGHAPALRKTRNIDAAAVDLMAGDRGVDDGLQQGVVVLGRGIVPGAAHRAGIGDEELFPVRDLVHLGAAPHSGAVAAQAMQHEYQGGLGKAAGWHVQGRGPVRTGYP